MVVILKYYFKTFLIDFRRFKYGISLFYSYFIFVYNYSLYYNFYSIFNSNKIVEF